MIAIEESRIESLLEILSKPFLTTSDEKSITAFKDYLKERKQFLVVSTVHRDDLESIGINTAHVEDGDIGSLPKKMKDDHKARLLRLNRDIIAKESLNLSLWANRVQLYHVDGTVTDYENLSIHTSLEELMNAVGGYPMVYAFDEENKKVYFINRNASWKRTQLNMRATKVVERYNKPHPIYGLMLECPKFMVDDYLMEGLKFYPGQIVWWEDPDRWGSGEYEVVDVGTQKVRIKEDDYECEVFFEEVKIR